LLKKTYEREPAVISELAHVRNWIFDLDNSLYCPSYGIFPKIDARMTAYISRLTGEPEPEARARQKRYFHEHGTTLAGLMRYHQVDPHEFLGDVHAIDLTDLPPNEALATRIAALPGRKFVFTNGDEPYARRVLGALSLADTFDGVHDIHACDYRPKPDAAGYHRLCERFGIDPRSALFVEDMAQNLRPAKALGMMTVWVNNGSERGSHGADPSFIDIEIADVSEWLASLGEHG